MTIVGDVKMFYEDDCAASISFDRCMLLTRVRNECASIGRDVLTHGLAVLDGRQRPLRSNASVSRSPSGEPIS
jgi:hypothetical protein